MSDLAPLCTLEEVKQALLYTDPEAVSVNDEELTRLIGYATAALHGMADVPRHDDGTVADFGEETFRETYDGNGGTLLILRRIGITRILGIEVGGTTIPAATDTTSAGFVRHRYGVQLRGYAFSCGVQNVRVTYQAGLADGDPLFDELRQAAIELVALVVKTKPFQGIQSKTLAQQTVVYMQQAMPQRTVKAVERLKTRWAA